MPERDSLLERRLLPRADREAFQYEIVRFHLEDLNALDERRRGRGAGRDEPPQDQARVAAIVRAARWDRAGFLRAIRRFVDEGRAEGDDAFGPALLLMAIGRAGDPLLAAAAPALRRRVEAALRQTGLDGAPAARAARAGAGAGAGSIARPKTRRRAR
jgi:hypothetical protein